MTFPTIPEPVAVRPPVAARPGAGGPVMPALYRGRVIVAAAVCPHPPLLVPALAAGTGPELAELRAACAAAVRTLLAARPELVLLIGTGARQARWVPAGHGTFAGYGVDLPVGFGTAAPNTSDGQACHDLSLLIGDWLLDQAATEPRPARSGHTVPVDLTPSDCAALGRWLARADLGSADPEPGPDRLGGPDRRAALLVLGDGSARRATAEPGRPDEAADRFDRAAAAALAGADPAGLLDLDPQLAAEVSAVGRAPWQVLAGAAEGRSWRAELHYDGAPFEVRYLVATWTPAGGVPA